MSAFVDADLAASLRAALANWDIPAVAAVAAIEPMDARHALFKISTLGPVFVLRDITGALNLSRLEFTRRVLTHVARSGLKVPVPILSQSAQCAVLSGGRPYLLTEFIPAGEYPSDPQLKPELFYQTGQAIAVLHQALATYADGDVSRQTWRFDPAAQIARWLANLSAGLPEQPAAVVRQVAVARGSGLEAALRGLPEQLIHRDCHPGNILLDGTRVIGFIDSALAAS